MTLIDDGLRIGDVMNCGHGTVTDTDLLMHDLDHRREAVGGARGGSY